MMNTFEHDYKIVKCMKIIHIFHMDELKLFERGKNNWKENSNS